MYPAGSKVHLILLLLLEAVINLIVSLYIIPLFFEALERANAVQRSQAVAVWGSFLPLTLSGDP